MSWIQQFLERFKKEEELDEMLPLHNTASPERMDRSKDLNARITYQYPKGQFRFPVIPDEHKPKERHHEHTYRKQKNQESHVKKAPVPSKLDPIAKSKKMSYSAFRPTEIPSPIFGFNRPKRTAIVHELSHFSKELTKQNEGKVINNEDMKQNIQEDVAVPNLSTTKVIERELPVANQTNSVDDLSNEPILPQKENLMKNDSEKTASSIKRDSILNQVKILEDDSFPPESRKEPFETENNNVTESVSPDIIADDMEFAAAPVPIELKEDIGQTVKQEIAEKEEVEQEYLQPKPEQPSNTVPAQIEKPKRQHLPFNVLMLKQDKQKWNVKKKQSDELENDKLMAATLTPKAESIDETEQHSFQPDAGYYEFPAKDLLNPPVSETMDTDWVFEQENLLNQTLENFNVGAKVVNVTQGPSVTRFEVQPEPGVKVNKVTNLSDDIKLSLAARDIRIEAPIPGKHTIGIEVPNQKSRPVLISEIISSAVFHESKSPLTAVLGLDISGKPIVTDLKKMPHGLIAGATGSGKSVCINSILVSLLYKARPEDLKLLLIDPKMVELAPYNHIPHLVSPVITDVKAATAALKWAVEEMERRYELFAHAGARDINRFNDLATQHKRYSDKLPYIVIVIDELADLMMMSPADVEEAICRIAQKARACGIHLIIATQRPSVDVITGLIKANVPTRIAFSVSSQVDSRTIIDISGAEKLLGRGDMLFLENGSSKPVRLQGTFVSDEEIDYVVMHVRGQRGTDYLFEQDELLKKAQVSEEEDELFYEACEFVVDQNCASTSSLQRRFKIGYNRAARLMDLMEQQGYISGAKGSKPRDVFISEADLEAIQEAGS